MENDDSEVVSAQRARRLGEIEFADFEGLPAHQSRVSHPPDHREREDQVVQAGAEKRDHRDGQQNTREGKKNVEEEPGEQAIHPTAVIARYRAYDRSDDGGY